MFNNNNLIMFRLDFDLELIVVHTDPKEKNVSLWLRCGMSEYQANILLAVIPYDN